MKSAMPIILSTQERSKVDTWARGKSFPLRLVQRARIIRMAVDGVQNQDIAQELGISRPTVQLWRQRFLAFRLDGLEKDAPRPGRIPKIPVRKVQAVIEATLRTTPPRQVTGALCRREESNPSSRPDAAGFTDEEGPLRDHDARLQTKRHNNVICGPQHARRHDYRRLSAMPSASRIYPFPQENRRRDLGRSRPALNRGQLRNPQTSQREKLAQTTSTVPPALYPDFEFLVEHGRAVVPRDYRQTHPSWHVSECACINRGY